MAYAPIRRTRRADARLRLGALPLCPEHHRRRPAPHAEASVAARSPSRSARCRPATPVFDWTIPREWNIRDAYVKNARGLSASSTSARSNLAVVSYSARERAPWTLGRVRPAHCTTLPDRPRWIPYRTSTTRTDLGILPEPGAPRGAPEGRYEVVVDSTLRAGSLTYGELLLRGQSADEVLISAHAVPSLPRERQPREPRRSRVSLAEMLRSVRRRCPTASSSRPGTIGGDRLARGQPRGEPPDPARARAACLGDAGPPHYKKSRRGDACHRPAARHVSSTMARTSSARFSPLGYDEAAVQLRRIRPARGLADAHAERRVSRVPHLRRRSRASCAREALADLARRSCATSSRSSRTDAVYRQHQPLLRAAAGQARPLIAARSAGARRQDDLGGPRCSGRSTSRTGATGCSTSRSARRCPSTGSAGRRHPARARAARARTRRRE
jgi:hypothetical protein